jgi:exosortase
MPIKAADGVQDAAFPLVETTPMWSANARWILLVTVAVIAAFHRDLYALLLLAFSDERYTYVLFVPLGSLAMGRAGGFSRGARWSSPWLGGALLSAGALAYLASWPLLSADSPYRLSFRILSILVIWLGGVAACCGRAFLVSFRAPLTFLLCGIPLPAWCLDFISWFMQKGSAEATYVLFRLVGVPVFRTGMEFTLPNVVIEVAEECSGIRSGMSLLLVSIVTGYLFLRLTGTRCVFVAAAIPIVIVKNAVRIVCISLLGIYVNPEFFHGTLHRSGGAAFSMVAIAGMGGLLLALKKIEDRRSLRHRASTGPLHRANTTPAHCDEAPAVLTRP